MRMSPAYAPPFQDRSEIGPGVMRATRNDVLSASACLSVCPTHPRTARQTSVDNLKRVDEYNACKSLGKHDFSCCCKLLFRLPARVCDCRNRARIGREHRLDAISHPYGAVNDGPFEHDDAFGVDVAVNG